MQPRPSVIASLVCFSLAACAAPSADVPDAAHTFDAGESPPDASDPFDAGDAPDAATAGDGGDPADAGVDLTCVDTAAEAPAECQYLDLERVLVRCEGELEFAKDWSDYERPQCPHYWTLFGRRCGTLDSVVAEARCNGRCQWKAFRSVSLVHCGQRNGYIVYRAYLNADGDADPECPDQYEFADGWFESFDAWADKNPCPDAGM